MKIKEIEQAFFDRLAEKLEELYPKGDKTKDRSTALVLNAYANIILKDLLKKLN